MTSVLRFALHYARRHWPGLITLMVLALIAAVVGAAAPWPLKYAVDDVLGPEGSQEATQLMLAASALVGVLVLAQVIVLVQRRLEVSLSRAVTVEVGADLFDRLQQVSLTDAAPVPGGRCGGPGHPRRVGGPESDPRGRRHHAAAGGLRGRVHLPALASRSVVRRDRLADRDRPGGGRSPVCGAHRPRLGAPGPGRG